jgi:hypothetical protein
LAIILSSFVHFFVIDPQEFKLILTDSPPFKRLIYLFRLIEAHLGVKENLDNK